MRKTGIPLLEQLREEQLKLEKEAKEKYERRRRVFKSWFGGNLSRRHVSHTTGMAFPPALVKWLPGKKLGDTFRGSPKDTNTSKKGDKEYYDETRFKWSVVPFKQALLIVLEGPELAKALLSGQPLTVRLVTDLVAQLFNEAIDELVLKETPDSTTTVVCNIFLPNGMLVNASIDELKEANVTVGFVSVNRKK